MIDTKDISVVVQGAIDRKNTSKCLKSIRKHLPGAEIILSTWKNSNTEGLDYDILVENEDPGAVHHDITFKTLNNTNRQLVSTNGGLLKAKNKYILKFRTDFYLTGNNFLNYWDKFPKSDEQNKYFNHRVIVASVYSREYSEVSYVPTPFHPSDFYLFGEADDIKNYFLNTPLMPDSDLSSYSYKYEFKRPYFNTSMRYSPEQYFCLSFFKQFQTINYEDWSDWNNENINQSENLLYSNFIFLGINESEIYSDKHSPVLENEIPGIITYNRFVNQYIKLYDKDFKKKESYTIKAKFNKHWKVVLTSFKRMSRYVSELTSVVYYSAKLMLGQHK